MHKKISKKAVIISVASIILIGIIVAIVFLLFTRCTIRINADDVQSIEVEISGAVDVGNFGSNRHFTVKDESNINYIITTIKSTSNKANNNKTNNSEMITASVNYKFTVISKNGSTEEYSVSGYSLSSENCMSKVLSSKEVVQQIRTAFTIDKSKISKVEYYYWEEDNTDTATAEEVTDSETINKIIDIAQKDVLANATISMEQTNSGFVFYDNDGNMLLAVSIYPTMEGYDELVKLFPTIPDYVNNL